MIVVMNAHAGNQERDRILKLAEDMGLKYQVYGLKNSSVIAIEGDEKSSKIQQFEACDGVDRVVAVTHPFKLASRDVVGRSTVIKVNGVEIGGGSIVVMAGPCAVEGRQLINSTALSVGKAGAAILRGGAFKPRTSPYSFQGLGEEGLIYLREAGRLCGMPVVSEVLAPEDVELAAKYTDILQIGSRNAQNYPLFREVGKSKMPVLLKRGMMNTIEEWIMSAEYILSEGNCSVILCERGIRTFERYTRNTLDLSAVAVVKKLSHLPVIVDPSHGTGHWSYVEPMALAAVAAGADGLLIEVHPEPHKALSDGHQSLNIDRFGLLMEKLAPVALAIGRKI
jgi:3-deoxy-7-phosphoheptulonate synthase